MKVHKKGHQKVSRQQLGRVLNRYIFPYPGTETINQAMKGLDTITQKLISQTLKQIDRVTDERIRQLINNGGKHVKTIEPKIIRGTKEHVYNTPFRLLANLARRSFLKSNENFSVSFKNKKNVFNRQNL